jgi:CRISPR-associated protein Cas1
MQRAYILEPGTYLRKSGPNIALVRGKKVVEEVALDSLQQLTLIGYTTLSGAVIRALINHRVETVLLNGRGRFEGRISIDEHKHVQRRQGQYVKLSDRAFLVRTARNIVHGKLKTQARFLNLRGQKLNKESLRAWGMAIRALSRQVAELHTGQDMQLVRGMEGHGSRLYFQAFPHLLSNPAFSFTGRNRRPPLDPVNALLSFVYTLLTNEVLTAIKRVGLDPYLGSLHEPAYGRPSLACDLVEEWRVFLGDRLVLGLLNRKTMSPDDFVYRQVATTDYVDEKDLKQKRPVEMKPGICRAFLKSYEEWMNKSLLVPGTNRHSTYRGLILDQARLFERYVLGEVTEYEPFDWSHQR